MELVCGAVEVHGERGDDAASVHIIGERAVNPKQLGVVVVNDGRDIGRAHGHAHIYRLNAVVQRSVNLVIRLLVGAREKIAVELEIVGEGVSVDINAADLPNGSSAAGNLPVGVGVLFGGYGNLFQHRAVRQLGFLDNRGRYTVGAVVCNTGLFICARRAAHKQNRRHGSR